MLISLLGCDSFQFNAWDMPLKQISYEIDPKNNDLLEITSNQDPTLSRKLIKYLCSLAAAIPINHIFSTMGASPRSVNQESISNDEKIEELLRSLGNYD